MRLYSRLTRAQMVSESVQQLDIIKAWHALLYGDWSQVELSGTLLVLNGCE